MLVEFNFKLSQLYYVRAAMVAVPTLLPDSHDVDWVQDLIDESKAARADYINKHGLLGLAQGSRGQAHEALHDACVAVYAGMKSAYRKDSVCLCAIDNLPVQDHSFGDTLERGQVTADCWGNLPNPPGWTTAFKVGPLTKTAFGLLVSGLETANQAVSDADQPFQISEGQFRKQKETMGDFVTAALTQGRAQFGEGTPERNALEAIPTTPATQLPGKAVIGAAESPSPGEVHFTCAADHATSWEVFLMGPGETEFVQVADVIQPGDYVATGLPAGIHKYKIVGLNSRGEGEASDVVELDVAGVGSPAVPSVSPPESLAAGEVHFQFESEGATGFEVWHKAPDESVYTLASTVPAVDGAGEYSASGQTGGVHWYKVRGVNAEGHGPFSTPVSLDVVAAAA